MASSRRTLARIHRSRIGTRYPKWWRENLSEGQKRFCKTKKSKKLKRENAIKQWKDPKKRKRLMEARYKGRKKARRNRRRAMKKTNKIIWNDPHYVRKMHKALKHNRRKNGVYGPSKIHLSIFRKMCRAGIKGIKMEYLIPPYCVDIAFPRKKVVIEIDGARWHKDKNKQKKRDKFLRSLGWKVFHIPAKRSCGQRLVEAIKIGGVDYACSSSSAVLPT